MRKIAVLMATVFVDMLGFAIVFPLLPFYALRLNADPWMIGWMIATFSIAQLASAPLWGRLSDRLGRRPAIVVGLLASSVAFVFFAFATSIWMLFLSRLIQGIGGGTTGVAQAYVGDSIEPKNRAKALGWLSAATSAGVMIGPAIGSLSTNLGTAAPGLIASSLCLINVFFAWRWLPESKAKSEHVHERKSIGHGVLQVLQHPGKRISRLVWIYAFGMLGFMSITAVIPLYLDVKFGVTEKTIGLFFVYVGMMSLIMRAVVLGKLVDRFGETPVLRFGAMSLVVGFATMGQMDTLVFFAIAMAAIPIGTACLFPATSALVTHGVSENELGQTLGIQQAFGGVARVFAPIWSTAAFQTLGIAVPFQIAAAVAFLVVLMAFRVTSAPEPVAAPALPHTGRSV